MKKIIRIFISLIILVTIIYFLLVFLLINRDDNKFKDLGYSKEQIEIINTLKDKDIILNYEYNSEIIDIISNKDFDEKNIKGYIEFSNKNDLNINDIIYIINNNLYDNNIEYNDDIVNLIKEKYYIHSNLTRYIEYKKSHDLDNYNIILNVNCNLDNDFYTNTSPTDLSKGDLILVNKYYYLAKDYIPKDLIKIDSKYGVSQYLNSNVYNKYIEMWNKAYSDGLSLYINSPYRSYSTQTTLYNNYAARDGYPLADTYSARAGFSEHQTGLAFDVTSKSTNFDTFAHSNEYEWLQDNAYKYGFILRYPKDKEYITGYQYESWHYRYVGIEVATKIKELGITFEEYYAYYVK